MKKVLVSLAFVAALAACDKTEVPTWTNPDPQVNPDGTAFDVKVTPVITKVTETKFENGDAIGLTITREAGVWADNKQLVFDGSVFKGDLKWYPEGTDKASVVAYYPYSAEVPSSFTVEADQSNGSSASDLVAGSLEEAYPSSEAIVVPFQHKLSLIVFTVVNKAEGDIVGISLDGAKLKANLTEDFTATVDELAAPASVKAYKANKSTYALILPPQTVALIAKAETAGGNILSQVCKEVTLEGGKKYNITLIVNPDNLLVVLPGDIADWVGGGDIPGEDDPEPGDVDFEEHLQEGYFTYHNVKYNVVKMKDNKWWMAQNLAYVPEGITPAYELSAVTAGVFYPIKVNEGQTAAEFDATEESVAEKGYLYQAEVALGLKVGDLTSVEAAQSLEGAQGICPTGWHVPTLADIQNLVGKVAGLPTVTTPYNTSAGDCYMDNLNADGFNMNAYGAISIQDNTKTTGSFMGFMTTYKDHLSSGMFCGSSYGGVTYNTSGDASSGIKNLQFYGLMPMTNKAEASQYTCNGTKVSYRIAAPLRCVRDAE